MNDFINWIALNNTLMIRIGFSAVVLLILVYIFRFFFIPKVSVVNAAESNGEGQGAAAGVGMSIEEIAELQAEIDTLKVKLKQSETEKINILNVNKSTGAGSGSSVDMVAASDTAKHSPDPELVQKLKALEARLEEYEIIAEDIAELSKLRQENMELKTKLDSIGTASLIEEAPALGLDELSKEEINSEPEISTAMETILEPAVDAENAINSEEAALIAAIPTDDPVETNLIIQSDVEVTPEEQSILDEFEKFQKTNKG